VYAREAVTEDLEDILRRHFPTPEMADIKGLSKPTRLEQQQVILKLFGYQLTVINSHLPPRFRSRGPCNI
jgi:hypothetical protein